MSEVQVKSKKAEKNESPSQGPLAGATAEHAVSQTPSWQLGAFYSAGPALNLGSLVQAKVAIGHPNDPYEQEADAVASSVSWGQSAPSISRIPSGGLSGLAQRQEEEPEEEEKETAQTQLIQRQEKGPEEEDEEPIQTQLVQRQEEESEEEEEETAQTQLIQRQEEEPEEEEEEPVQTQLVQRQEKEPEEEKEETVQAQLVQRQVEPDEEEEEESVQTQLVQRQEEEPEEEEEETIQTQLVQRQEEEPEQEEEETAQTQLVQRQEEGPEEEDEEPIQTQLVQRQEEEPEEEEEETAQTQLIQRQEEGPEEEDEEPAQAQFIQRQEEGPEEEDEEPAQAQFIQRQEEEPEEEDEEPIQTQLVQRQEEEPEEEEEETAQLQRAGGSPNTSATPMRAAAAHAIDTKGPGTPMEATTRHTLEASLGTDLSDVRVHQDDVAHQSTAALKARAFTHRNHIWLGRGESQSNLKLMAHETSHVLQQDGIVRRKPKDPDEEEPSARGPIARAAPTPARAPLKVGAAIATAAAATPSVQRPIKTTRPPDATQAEPTAAKRTPEEKTKIEEPAGAPVTPGAPAAVAEAKKEAIAPPAKVESGIEPDAAKAEAIAKEEKPAEPPAPPSPESDPRFQGVMRRLEKTATEEKAHAPAAQKVAEAQAAAAPPENGRSSRAQANQVDVMSQQEAKKVDKDDFLSLLRAELKRIAPKNMEETEKFKKEGKAGKLKASLTQKVSQQKIDSARDIEGATKAKPDPSGVQSKPVTPLPKAPGDPAAANLRSQNVLPQPKADAEISAEKNKQTAEQVMAANDIDEEQLKKANEPQFSDALKSKQSLEEHADQVPQIYRTEEKAFLGKAKAQVRAQEEAAKSEMRAKRQQAKGAVRSAQQEAKRKEEEERKRVADKIQGMYATTKKKVEDKLNALDKEVNRLFDDGEKRARNRFESYVDRRMATYKWNRYLKRFGGAALWLKDKLFGMPDEVNKFYAEGREQYISDMDAVLVKIANAVETRLKEAKDEIARGKEEIRKYVEGLPENLQKAGQAAEKDVSSKFGELEKSVDAKKKELAQKMAKRYNESRAKLDKRIAELKKANQGLVDGFVAKIKEIAEMLRKFKERIMGLLKKSASTLRLIVKDPVGFLKNLLQAVKQGFKQFSSNIITHLQKGLIDWLFGTMSNAGIEIPTKFDLKGIFGLVLQVLGITRDRIRAKIVKLIGEKNVGRIEKAWSVVSTIISEGPAGLWKRVKQYIGNLKKMVIDAIRNWLITQIIKQAVIWVISLFNPAAALLKAIKLIYDVIMFFVENIERILKLVEAVIQSISMIVTGKIGAAANWIEKSMARTIPIIIGFLARLLGLSGISAKIKSIIKKIQKKVDKAIDKVLKKIVKGIKRLIGKGRGGKKAPSPKRSKRKKQQIRAGLAEIDELEKKYMKTGRISREDAQKVAREIKKKHAVFRYIKVIDGGDSWDYEYAASASSKKPGEKKLSVGDIAAKIETLIKRLKKDNPEAVQILQSKGIFEELRKKLGIKKQSKDVKSTYMLRKLASDPSQIEKKLVVTNEMISQVLEAMLNAYSDWTNEHCQRVGQLAKKIALFIREETETLESQKRTGTLSDAEKDRLRELRKLKMDDEMVEKMIALGRLHDIGKLFVRKAIIDKPGSLTGPEFGEVETHPTRGAKVLALFKLDHHFVRAARFHHASKKPDKGYPDKAKDLSKVITRYTRILQLADALDAMIKKRPGKPAITDYKELVKELQGDVVGRRGSDPFLFDTFVVNNEKLKERLENFYAIKLT